MKVFRKTLLLILILLVVAQFVQPVKNQSESPDLNDISEVYRIPQEVHQILVSKCYDCHSNNTRYPWYFNIQPVGWWLAAHIHEGKEHLNFSNFKSYSQQKAQHKLEEIAEVIEERSMPLRSYVLFHPSAELTEEDEQKITGWLKSIGAIDD